MTKNKGNKGLKRNIILILLMGVLSVAIFGIYQYNKPHRNVVSEKAAFNLTIDEMHAAFSTNISNATSKFSEKVVEVEGKIAKVEEHNSGVYYILLKGENGKINCEIDPGFIFDPNTLSVGDEIALKGLFIGYDDLLNEIQLKKCSIEQ